MFVFLSLNSCQKSDFFYASTKQSHLFWVNVLKINIQTSNNKLWDQWLAHTPQINFGWCLRNYTQWCHNAVIFSVFLLYANNKFDKYMFKSFHWRHPCYSNMAKNSFCWAKSFHSIDVSNIFSYKLVLHYI